MTALDYCWARYVRGVADKNAIKSASWAALLYGLTAFLYVSIVRDPWLVIPACLGAFCGTWIGVTSSFDKWRSRPSSPE